MVFSKDKVSLDIDKAFIPFNRACPAGNEWLYVSEAIECGPISGDGPFAKKCQALLESELGTTKALLTTSCTHALEMTALLLNIQAGDEFIIPSFTFVSTALAFALRGAKPVFADIRPDTLNLDENLLEQLITRRTKAVIVVHYAGVACELDTISEILKEHGIPLIEDNAHGLFGKYRGKPLGTFGCLATQSFHETKNFTCGEGGALLINDDSLIDRAEIIRDKGTDRSRFWRGEVDKYTWMDIGSSYVLSDMLAAFLFAQLEAREEIQNRRKNVWEFYHKNLQDWAALNNIALPTVPPHCEHPYHLFYLLLNSLDQRQSLITHLKKRNILSVFHYQPLHLSKMGRLLGGKKG